MDCEEKLKFALVEETRKLLEGKVPSINAIDGVRVEFGDGWGLLRASNTQPVLVLRFEAPSQQILENHRKVVEGALAEAARRLGHPAIQMDHAGGGH